MILDETYGRLMGLIESVEDHGMDLSVTLDIGAECGWGCELRFTPLPNREGKPDRSLVFVATGNTPEEVLRACLEDFTHAVGPDLRVHPLKSDLT